MASYPVVFTYEELVKGRGFVAVVRARGRALMVHEDDEWWMYGVQPGVLSEGGDTFDESRLLFRQAFREILYDVAGQSGSFADFKNRTLALLHEINEPILARWNDAVTASRSSQTELEEPLQALDRVPADQTPVEFRVDLLEPTSIVPDNRVDEFSIAQAA